MVALESRDGLRGSGPDRGSVVAIELRHRLDGHLRQGGSEACLLELGKARHRRGVRSSQAELLAALFALIAASLSVLA